MRRFLSALVLVLILSLFLSNVSFSQGITVDIAGSKSTYTGNVYNLELNGIWVPTQTPCIVISGFAYVPLREVFQDYLGMTVGYDSSKDTAYVQSGSNKMEFSFSEQVIYENGVKVDTDLPVAAVNGNTMVPLSLTAGYFGYTVSAKENSKILTIQWNNRDDSAVIVKEANISGTVSKISYYVENGNEVILIETNADRVMKHFVLAPMDGNPYYRLCVQFGNADINIAGNLDVYSGSVQQIRYAQADAATHVASVVTEVNHNPKYTVDIVPNGIKIIITSVKNDSNETNAPVPTKAPEPTKAPTPMPTQAPKPTMTPAPKPTEAPLPTPIPITPTPTPEPSKQVGNGALRYTMDGQDLIVWIDGVDLLNKIKEDPVQYKVEYRNIEKMLQIRMPLTDNFKTEVLPGNSMIYGIISSNSRLHNEVNIRISGKDDLNWVLASNGNIGSKIILSDSDEIANKPNPTPSPIPVKPTPAPEPTKPTPPQTTPAPTPVPPTDELANRGQGDRSGTISYVAGSDRLIIDTIGLNEYRIFRLSNPARIVIDLYDNIIESKDVDVPNGRLYSKIRTGQFENTTARIVLEIPDNINYEADKNGNRLTIKLSYSGIKNMSFIGDVGKGSLKLTGSGIWDKIEKNMANIIIEDDKKSNTFTFVFPNGIIDLGNGKLKVGDSVMKSVQTLTSGDNSFLVIEREKDDIQYRFRYINSDEVIIETTTDNTSPGTISEPGSETKPGTAPTPTPSGKLVVLDAGHGGSDPGATYGKDEKWYNLDITLRLEKLLKAKGVNVKLTRTNDAFIGLDERAIMANEWDADVFISIHHNALMKDMHGTMTFFYPGSYAGKEYATIIQNDLIKNLGSNDLGVKTANFVVIKKTKMPAVLVEIGCLTNDQELSKLNTEEYRQQAAESLCESILKIVSK